MMTERTVKVNILGAEWKIIFESADKSPRYEKFNGWCDMSVRECHVGIRQPNEYTQKDMDSFCKMIARHEIIHAFIYESGILTSSDVYDGKWAKEESMIDWIAVQSPKIFEVFNIVGVW